MLSISPIIKFGDAFNQMESLYDSMIHHFGYSDLSKERVGFVPPATLIEKDGNYVVSVETPGISKDKIKITYENKTVIIDGEKSSYRELEEELTGGYKVHIDEKTYGKFRREFLLPKDADLEKATASYENGVLSLTISKLDREKEKPTRQIEIT